MNPDSSSRPVFWRITLIGTVMLVLILAAFSIRSIRLALRSAEQGPMTEPVSRSLESPDSQPVVPPPPPLTPAKIQSGQPAHGISKEFDIIRQREDAQKETLRLLRKEAKENPNADHILTEEQIKQMEKSGALVM